MKSLNVIDFPEDVLKKLKARAALMGTTLRELVIESLTKLANSGGK